MGGALLFTAMLFGAFGFGVGWWLRDVTYRVEDARAEAEKQRNERKDG